MNSRPPSAPPPLPDFEAYRPNNGDTRGALAGQRPMGKRRPPPPRRNSVLKSVLFGLAFVLVALSAAGAVIVSTISPAELVRAELIDRVKAATGRDLVIAGPASFRLFPSIGFTLSDVSLSAPEGSNAKPVVTMASLDISVRLLTLLRRKVVVERLILNQPVFELHIDKDGRKTWDMAAQTPPRPIRLAQTGTNASDAKGGLPKDASQYLDNAAGTAEEDSRDSSEGSGLNLQNLELGNVRLEAGVLHYSDARTATLHDASGINMRLSLRSISRPLEATGSLVWKNEKIDLDGKLTSIKMLMEDHPAKIALSISSRPINASYDGSFIVRDGIDAEGAVTADAASLRDLAKWLGADLPPVTGFGPLQIKGLVRAAGKVVSLNNANIMLDGATITGQVSVDTAPVRPYVKGALKVSELDLNKYAGSADGAIASESKPVQAKTAPGAAAPAQSIDELLTAPAAVTPGPKVKGYTKRAGWSEGPIDASALGLVEADATLTVGKLLFKEIKTGQSVLNVALKDKVMRTTFEDIQLYGGRGRGIVTLDATAPNVAGIGANISLEGIAAQPLLRDAAGTDWLAGTGKLSLAVAGQGANQRQIVETLNGKADIVFANGAIVGWNIPGMVRGLSQGKLSGLNRTPAEKTDFSELASSWTITNGIAQNQDLRLVSPLLRVAGAGSVMLPPREVDYTIRPTLVASLEGQGASNKPSGLEIPVRIHGSWDKPTFTPDVAGVLKDPNQALQAVKELGKQYKGKSTDEIVKGLLGEDGDANASPQTGTTNKDKGKQLLDKLFKQ